MYTFNHSVNGDHHAELDKEQLVDKKTVHSIHVKEVLVVF
ncbi:hypothetical protein bthur0004_30170 [Bacillus thuringiensis serovar sotto str. T04001]|nr:hypothetical protein bthur0004_30170 [Bacillus thuringiensis serovar sotto str. T04001]